MIRTMLLSWLILTGLAAVDVPPADFKELQPLLRGEDRRAAIAAVERLGAWSGPRHLELLTLALSHRDWLVREAAVTVVAAMDPAAAKPALNRLTADRDERIAAAAVAALARLLGEDARASLLKILGTGSVLLRRTAVEELGRLPYPGDESPTGRATLQAMANLLTHEDLTLRQAVVAAVAGWTSSPAIIRTLLHACADSCEEIVCRAGEALVGRAGAEAELLRLPTGNRKGGPLRICLALAPLATAAAAPSLLRALRENDTDLAAAAAEALGHLALRDPQAVQEATAVLVNRLQSEDWGLRAAAAWALCCLGEDHGVLTVAQAIGRQADDPCLVVLQRQIQAFERKQRSDWLTWLKDQGPGIGARFRVKPEASATVRFFGLSDRTRHAVFVIDCSGSMIEDNKLIEAKRQLWDAVVGLESAVRFNVVRFEVAVEVWHPEGPLRASWRNRGRLREYLSTLRANGGTDLCEGVLRGLKEAGVETTFLLSDGLPSAGITRPLEILERVTNLNHDRKNRARLFTIGLKAPAARGLLESLANQNGGQCRMVD